MADRFIDYQSCTANPSAVTSGFRPYDTGLELISQLKQNRCCWLGGIFDIIIRPQPHFGGFGGEDYWGQALTSYAVGDARRS
jgi:hypothetical protein